MPLSKNLRTPIPKFTRAELDKAQRCAKALWYGIDYESGESRISDAEIMDKFATKFYYYHKNKIKHNPDIFEKDVKELIKACKPTNLFRWIKKMDFTKGIESLYADVYPIFLNAQKKSSRISTYQDAIKCLVKLNDGLVIGPYGNQYNLASRLLFFVSPNLHTFNLNSSVAIHFGLQVRTQVHFKEYFQLFADGMITNQTKLSKYKMPPVRDGLDIVTWNEASRTDWWKRKILDIAVLLHTNPKIKIDPNLQVYIKRRIKQDEI
jgi:hypothetical protein